MRAIDSFIRKKIHKLRKNGHSIPEISRDLKLPKSTVSRYVKDVKILPQFFNRWLARRNASKIMSERNLLLARQKADNSLRNISKRDLMLIGASIYWAEGTKRDFNFINADAEMIRTFVFIIKNVFDVKREEIKVSLRIYEDLNKKECLKFWSGVTGIELDDSTSIEVLRGRKVGKLKYGMCRVRVKKGGLLLKEIFAIIGRINELISPHSSMDRTTRS